jgi:hypothetical protein
MTARTPLFGASGDGRERTVEELAPMLSPSRMHQLLVSRLLENAVKSYSTPSFSLSVILLSVMSKVTRPLPQSCSTA